MRQGISMTKVPGYTSILAISMMIASLANADIILSGATVHDGTGSAPIESAVIRVVGEKIACIGAATQCAPEPGDEVIDVSGQYITPGLVDAHVHFMQTGWLDGRPHWDYLEEFYDYEALQASLRENQDRWHRAYLCSGVTAVYDPGGLPWTPSYEKAARGNPKRVHYRGSGPLITHVNISLQAMNADTFLPMDSDEEVQAGIEKLVEWGARAVKVWFLDPPVDRREELNARLIKAGELARLAGLPLIVHATELHNAKQALRAGAKMLVHSVEDRLVDDEFITLARQADVIYAPTLQVGGNWRRARATIELGMPATPDDPNGCIDPETRRVIADAKALQSQAYETPPPPDQVFADLEAEGQARSVMLHNLKTIYDAGITVVAGTDAGNPLTFHGPAIYRELELMEAAGIPAVELIAVASRNGAEIMNMQDRIGTLEEGKIADLIVLTENPTVSTGAFRSVQNVMHLGVYYPVGEFSGNP
jgi:imidazolonepropionase-like amidohydrolase